QPLPIVLYGEDYWRGIIDFDRMVTLGTISKKDLKLFHYANSPEEAFDYLSGKLSDVR
ncbi:MAG: LOG family protein, partial [Thermoplasmata archaeon]|nr:LOG family protein [Thermoplasmata archaeon]